jgi:hypothetical protein
LTHWRGRAVRMIAIGSDMAAPSAADGAPGSFG